MTAIQMQQNLSDTANITKEEIPRMLDSWKMSGKSNKNEKQIGKRIQSSVRTECLGREERHGELRDF